MNTYKYNANCKISRLCLVVQNKQASNLKEKSWQFANLNASVDGVRTR